MEQLLEVIFYGLAKEMPIPSFASRRRGNVEMTIQDGSEIFPSGRRDSECAILCLGMKKHYIELNLPRSMARMFISFSVCLGLKL